jgi:hypothetical protein
MVTDKSLLEWYVKGFKDELNGTSSVESENRIENRAYMIGALDAVCGDDVTSIDRKSDEEILTLIKKYFK